MDMMAIRRRVMMAQKKLPDTTVQIAEYGYSWGRGKYVKETKADYGISVFYSFPPSSSYQTVVTMCLSDQLIAMIQKDDAYVDWWGQTTVPSGKNWQETEGERKILNPNSNEVSFSIYLPLINDTYVYIKETGQILFAGKNTPYYGYTNINDMP